MKEFKEGRNWAVIIGNSYAHQVIENGDPEHMIPILKKVQIDTIKAGEGDRLKTSQELDYTLEEMYPECTSDLMEVYIHDWIYMLDPDGDIRYGKKTDENCKTLTFKDFKDG
jgi:hypothetical protein